jgi:hypothetical protein
MAKITSIGKILHRLKKFHVNKLYRKIEESLSNWLDSRIQSGRQKQVFNHRVQENELKSKYIEACTFLLETIGKDQLGDYLQFGVPHGTALSIMHSVLKKLNLNEVRLFGFDSFEGTPETSATGNSGRLLAPQFASSIGEIKNYLTKKGVDWKRTFLIEVGYSATLAQWLRDKRRIKKASFIMIDCVIYTASKQALDFCKPLITDKAIIFFNDWKDDINNGKYRAWNEFLNENPQLMSKEFGTYYPTGKIFEISASK